MTRSMVWISTAEEDERSDNILQSRVLGAPLMPRVNTMRSKCQTLEN